MCEKSIGRFSKKGKQLQNIALKLLDDIEFVTLVANPVGGVLPVGYEPSDLINTRIYTQYYKPPTDEKIIYVCVFYSKGRITNKNTYYKNSDITVSIIVHRDLWNTENSIRGYDIADRVDLILNRNNTTESLSNDWFKDFNYYSLNGVYSVLELSYSNWD